MVTVLNSRIRSGAGPLGKPHFAPSVPQVGNEARNSGTGAVEVDVSQPLSPVSEPFAYSTLRVPLCLHTLLSTPALLRPAPFVGGSFL